MGDKSSVWVVLIVLGLDILPVKPILLREESKELTDLSCDLICTIKKNTARMNMSMRNDALLLRMLAIPVRKDVSTFLLLLFK
jgi:hypothetical protein